MRTPQPTCPSVIQQPPQAAPQPWGPTCLQVVPRAWSTTERWVTLRCACSVGLEDLCGLRRVCAAVRALAGSCGQGICFVALSGLLSLWSSRHRGLAVMAHGLSCPMVCGIFPNQGLNLCPLHWQVDSHLLRHSCSPRLTLFLKGVFIQNKLGKVCRCCLTPCDPVDCSMPGFPVFHYLLKFAQTHVH